jgi:hypothetical protein
MKLVSRFEAASRSTAELAETAKAAPGAQRVEPGAAGAARAIETMPKEAEQMAGRLARHGPPFIHERKRLRPRHVADLEG